MDRRGVEVEARVGLVGCGRIAERGYAPALASAGLLAGVADLDPGRCARVAPGLPAFRSAKELVGALPLDLVVVATPAVAHLEDAATVADAGLRCIVEKPPATTAAEAALLADLTPAPVIGFNRRFQPPLRALRRAVRAAEGSVDVSVRLAIEADRWAPYVSADGPLLDLGSHAVDLVRWLTGEEITAVEIGEARPAEIELDLALDRGSAHVSVSHDDPWLERVEARVGDEVLGSVQLGGGAIGRLRALVGRGGALSLPETLREQVRAAAGLDADDAPLATVADGIAVMRVLDAVAEAAAAGRIGRAAVVELV